MKYTSKFTGFLLLIALFSLLGGCATNRGIVSLEFSDNPVMGQANGKRVFIRSVVDNRVFEENPKSQDIPSLGFEGAANATDDIKKRAIARKRNGYGKAMGDILLKDGETVETVIADALKRAFSEAGYQVVETAEAADNATTIIDVKIQKFWSYMTPGFWALSLTSDISTDIATGPETKTITVRAEGHYQAASGGNWIETMQNGLRKYIEEVKQAI